MMLVNRPIADARQITVEIVNFGTSLNVRMKAEEHKGNPDLFTEQLEAITRMMHDGVIIIDVQGMMLNVNPAAAELFGYRPHELTGHPVTILMPEEHSAHHDSYIKKYLDTREARIIGTGRELEGVKKDGSRFPFRLSVEMLTMGEDLRFIGILHDMTEIREKERQLEVSRRQLHAVFETAVDGIIIIDSTGVIRMVNPAAARLFGYTIKAMLGQRIELFMPEPDASRHHEYMEHYHDTGRPRIIGIGREVNGKKRDGSTFPFHLGVSRVDVGSQVFYTGIIHDLSEQKEQQNRILQLNQELEKKVQDRTEELTIVVNRMLQTNERLRLEVKRREQAERELLDREKDLRASLQSEKELSRMKSRFVSMASHEFRTPLSTILSSASLIGRYAREGTTEPMEKHVQRIKSSVSNLNSILNDFLSIGKIEDGIVDVNFSYFDLREFLSDILDDVQGLMKKDQTIEIIGPPQRQLIYLDKHLLKNIYINLVSNGIKYSEPGKTIYMTGEVDGDKLRGEVRDEGMGIPTEDQQQLFERFFRAQNVTNIQGTGLGLYIVKQYLSLLEGTIGFESVPEKGTRFYFEIPLKEI